MIRCGNPYCSAPSALVDGKCPSCGTDYSGFGTGNVKPALYPDPNDLSPSDKQRLLEVAHKDWDTFLIEYWMQRPDKNKFLVDFKPLFRSLFLALKETSTKENGGLVKKIFGK